MWFGRYASRANEAKYPSLWRGLVGAWSPGITGPTGVRAFDLSGLNNNGTATNVSVSTFWGRSQGRWGWDFDGTNDYVDLGQWQPISTSNAFTLSAWVRVLNFTSNFVYLNICTLRTNAGRFGFYISPDGPARYLGMLMGSQNAAWGRFKNDLSATLWPGVWRHVVYTYDGVSPTLNTSFATYFDGLPIAVNAALGFGTQLDRSAIGWDGAGVSTAMLGLIDDLHVYRRVLSHSEIRCLASRRGILFEPKKLSFARSVDKKRRRNNALVGLF